MRDDMTFSVVAVELFERPVRLRLPFRFGGATLREAPQAFVRARIRFPDGRSASGWAAEMMMPKWFDKSPQRSNAQNLDDLRRSLLFAAHAYESESNARTAFGHAASHYRLLLTTGADEGLNALVASFGAALVDRAILDAVCRGQNLSFATAIRNNVPAIDAALAPDLRGFAFDAFLAALLPVSSIAARHTVGLLDPLTSADVVDRPDDLPVALDEVIARYGHRHFKLKLSGNVAEDIERLTQTVAVLDALPEYAVTLDGNEQFESVETVRDFWRAVDAAPRLQRLESATLYLEQPLPRELALSTDVHALARLKPLIIDESDANFDVFPLARRLGYAGVSGKSC
ncbi:MAG TPA: enolase C-terminal domain-like protein, partial [Casimicrobiaceae bacterium]